MNTKLTMLATKAISSSKNSYWFKGSNAQLTEASYLQAHIRLG